MMTKDDTKMTHPNTDAPAIGAKGAEVVVDEKEGEEFVELLKAMLAAAVIALLIRSFLFEPFNIPSGSMFPTLKVGDYLFVEKYSYGYSKYSFPLDLGGFDGRVWESPVERGDIAVFRQPKKVHIDYIKRIIGLPGDRIQVRGGLLHINGEPVTRELVGTEEMKDAENFMLYNKYIETLPNGVKHFVYEISDVERLDDTEEFIVPEEHYFAMGDNRDSSMDSRVEDQVGYVPAENMIGRASFIFFSTEGTGTTCDRDGSFAAVKSLGCKLIEWPQVIRYSRFFRRVNVFQP